MTTRQATARGPGSRGSSGLVTAVQVRRATGTRYEERGEGNGLELMLGPYLECRRLKMKCNRQGRHNVAAL